VKRIGVLLIFMVASFGLLTLAVGQQVKPTPTSKSAAVAMDRYSGLSVKTDLGYGISINKGSSLKREWFVVRDENAPAALLGEVGINVIYKSGEKYSSGQYLYEVIYQVKPQEPIAAIELRVHVLDVFGKLLKTLSATQLDDFSEPKSFTGNWRIWSENEAAEAFASVAYIAQVRTASGRVYEADTKAIFDQVRKVAKRITEADLEPKRESPSKP
jgi:hypothetical protein